MSATYIIVTNASANTLSLEGDDRNPSVDIARAGTANINMKDVLGNNLLCTTLAAWVTAGTVTITRGGVAVTAAQLTAYIQGADMDRVDYDTDDDLVVDKAEAIDATSRTKVAVTPYTVLATDNIIEVNATVGAFAVNLPAGVDGKTYTIKDGLGLAGTNAITITPAAGTIDGAATLVLNHNRDSVDIYYDLATTDWKVVNRVENKDVKAINTTIDMKNPAANVLTLNGGASRTFLIKEIRFICTAGVALNGDVEITVGNTVGGVEIMGVTPLTGLSAANETFSILMAGEFPAIPGNDVLDISVTTGDTGTSGTMTAIIIGEEV